MSRLDDIEARIARIEQELGLAGGGMPTLQSLLGGAATAEVLTADRTEVVGVIDLTRVRAQG